MTTLSEIEAAEDNLQLRSELTMQWSQDRGFGDHPICVHAHMRYIERLEAALQSIANNTCCVTCQEAKLVAQKALAQHDREEAR